MKRLFKLLAPAALLLVLAVPLVSAQGTPIGEADVAAGEQAYNSVCVACHQPTGQGIPSAFPPLAGHFPELVAAEGGREFVINVVLFGMQGAITVDGVQYTTPMPPQAAAFNDQQVADVLNYVSVAWENAALLPEGFLVFTPDEVAALRDAGLTPTQVYELRETLALEGN